MRVDVGFGRETHALRIAVEVEVALERLGAVAHLPRALRGHAARALHIEAELRSAVALVGELAFAARRRLAQHLLRIRGLLRSYAALPDDGTGLGLEGAEAVRLHVDAEFPIARLDFVGGERRYGENQRRGRKPCTHLSPRRDEATVDVGPSRARGVRALRRSRASACA